MSNNDSVVQVPYERPSETELSLVSRRAQIFTLGLKITLISSLCAITKQIQLPSDSSQLSSQHTEIRATQQERVGNKVKNYDNALEVPRGGSSRKGLKRQQNK